MEVQRTIIEAALKHALEKENIIFDNESAVFKYLKGAGLPTNLIYDNADEIEVIWKRLSGIPPTPSSEPLEAPFQNPDLEKTHSSDLTSRGSRVPVFDKDTEPILVLITKPDDGTFGHANTRHCEGVESYINIRTVEQTPLQRKDDGTVIISWMYTKKHIRHEQIANQTIRYTRCIVLDGEDAEAMQVDILWGTGFEAGVTYPPTNPSPDPDLPKSTGLPQTLLSQTTDPFTAAPSNDTIAAWGPTPVLIQNIWYNLPSDQIQLRQLLSSPVSAIPYGTVSASNDLSRFGAGHPNGDLMAGRLPTVGPTANPHILSMNSSNSAGYIFHDAPSGRQGKRKADDEAGTCIKPKRPATTNHPSNG
ncbi:hypothetical protein M434DRAFT_38188 [Hypoxylon sp. CO27-5]|nr:hypothetical protein M434DRAFT_38188 [Hypoxylon sp. CO27-5]